VSGNHAGTTGGGIVSGEEAAVTVTESSVTDNTVGGGQGFCQLCRAGGGIASGGSLTVVRSTIADNTAVGRGGGISAEDGGSILRSKITGNSAGFGGGIAARGAVTFTNSTVAHNNAVEVSEAGGFETGGEGGGIYNAGSLTLAGSSSVIDNAAVFHGGGILNEESAGATLTFAPNWRGVISGNTPDDIFNG
jgi:hypothetical protein